MSAPAEILMVEDSATDAELAVWEFKHARVANPFKVVTSGEEGLDYLFGTGAYAKTGAARPQLVLLDLNLIAMSGIDFLRRIKADERTRDIPVVILTLSTRDRDIMAGVRLGAAGQIIKPLRFETLIRTIARLKLELTLVPPVARR